MKYLSHPSSRRSALKRQRGVTTLIVVMVLFFIVSLVAAYANRNLIFEQRTSANQYRSTQALEAAEAGVEWALAMLNHQRIDDLCKNSTVGNSYRVRYLEPLTVPVTGNLIPKLKADGINPRSQSCVYNGTDWNCSCPSTAADPAPTAPTSTGLFPAFHVRLEQPLTTRPGVVVIHSVGCTRLDTTCLTFGGAGINNEGRAAVRVLAALAGNAASPPSAAVMARGSADTGLGDIYNTAADGSGITLHCGGSSCTGGVPHSKPGTPGDLSRVPDPSLLLAPVPPFSASDRFFASIFNMTAATFEYQPAVLDLPCPGGTCGAASLRAAIDLNPGRPVWVRGNLVIDSAGDIGTATSPVLLVVNGNLNFTTAANVYGLVYVRTDWDPSGTHRIDWVTSGTDGQIVGAVVVEAGISGTGTPTIVRNPDVLSALRHSVGSFVRVPGSWRDFQ